MSKSNGYPYGLTYKEIRTERKKNEKAGNNTNEMLKEISNELKNISDRMQQTSR